MWMFYIDGTGNCPLGSSGQAHTNYKSEKYRISFANSFKGKRSGSVWGIPNWTPEMSEYGPTAFVNYIWRHGKRYA